MGDTRIYVYGLLHRSGFCGKGYSNYRSISIKNYPPRKIWIMQAANLIVLVEDMFCVLIVIVESWTLVQL